MTYDQWKTDSGYDERDPSELELVYDILHKTQAALREMETRALHAETVLAEQDAIAQDQDPPAKWLDEALRGLARDLVADPKTTWIGERDPKQHICWTAADRLARLSPSVSRPASNSEAK